MPDGSTSPTRNNATRRIPKATYVPLTIPAADPAGGRAVLKFAYIRQLSLQPGEIDTVQGQLSGASLGSV